MPGVIASLANPSINSGFAKGDSYSSIENLSGSKYDDALNGDNAVNTIRGGVGGDSLKGYGGNDTLFGDAGADKFIFNSALDAATNVDTGKLFYDADGNGANFAGVQFATLTGMPTITAADFEVI